MRYLILSDIHGNREALEAVVSHAHGRYDRVVCCGDLCDYGPEPNFTIDWVRAYVYAVIRGNHDRVCAGLDTDEEFSELAQVSARWTTEHLTAANRTYLCELPMGPLGVDDCLLLAHGSPRDEDEYVTNVQDVKEVFSFLKDSGSAALPVFFGHTHLQGAFVRDRDGGLRHISRPAMSASETVISLEADASYVVNVGSVGQPRDGDSRAAYALFDAGAGTITLCRVPYDYAATERKIAAAGLPARLGTRLALGR